MFPAMRFSQMMYLLISILKEKSQLRFKAKLDYEYDKQVFRIQSYGSE